MAAGLWMVWAQAARGRDTSASLLIALAAAAAVLAIVATIFWQRRRRDLQLDEYAGRYGLEAATAAGGRRVRAAAIELFGEGARVERLLRRPMAGLDIHLARLRVPMYRVDPGGVWDTTVQESQVKLVVLASGFADLLPTFRLMPNSWALTTVRGERANVFHDVAPMGWRNFVIGEDEAAIQRVLAGEPSHLLRRNRHLTIDSRGDFLAFYLQDQRPQPRDLAGFVDRCLALAEAITHPSHAG